MSRKITLMTGLVLLALLVGIAFFYFYPWDETADGARSNVSAEHLAPFQGRWMQMSQNTGGPLTPTGAYFFIRDDIVRYTVPPGLTGVPAYYYVIDAVDPNQDPPWIDLTLVEVVPSGRKIAYRQRGVYRLEGDMLIIRRGRPGEARPSKVVTEPGQGETVFILKRARENEP